ncbi:MAG: hypothetical protein D6785_08545, partial [Planctomycetota bacterium]
SLEFLRNPYEKMAKALERLVSSGQQISKILPKISLTQKEAQEALEKLNSRLLKKTRISKNILEDGQQIVEKLESSFFSDFYQNQERFFGRFHPWILHLLWKRFWSMEKGRKKFSILLETLLPFWKEKEERWHWFLELLLHIMVKDESFRLYLEENPPSYLDELFLKCHRLLWETQNRIEIVEEELQNRRLLLLGRLAQEIQLPMKILEGWISSYLRFRKGLENLGLRPLEELSALIQESNSRIHHILPPQSSPPYKVRFAGIGLDQEILFPAILEGEPKEEKKNPPPIEGG